MSCSQCGEICVCGPRSTSRAAVAEDPGQLWPATDAAWKDSNWRKEISSRVRAHKKLRGIDDDSLSLDFSESQELLADPVEDEIQLQPEPPLPPPPSRYQRIAMKRAQAQVESGNLIVFPPPEVDPVREALAEPIPETPRILEAGPEPAAAAQAPLFSAIELDTPAPLAHPVHDEFQAELPLPVAPLSTQAVALAIDAVLSLSGFAIFATIVHMNTDIRLAEKTTVAAAVTLAGAFWVVYQFIFLVYAGTTPGMSLVGAGLCTPEETIPCRATRIKRAAALALSSLSFGMGFAWAAIDEDQLAWHDRISRTYLRLL